MRIVLHAFFGVMLLTLLSGLGLAFSIEVRHRAQQADMARLPCEARGDCRPASASASLLPEPRAEDRPGPLPPLVIPQIHALEIPASFAEPAVEAPPVAAEGAASVPAAPVLVPVPVPVPMPVLPVVAPAPAVSAPPVLAAPSGVSATSRFEDVAPRPQPGAAEGAAPAAVRVPPAVSTFVVPVSPLPVLAPVTAPSPAPVQEPQTLPGTPVTAPAAPAPGATAKPPAERRAGRPQFRPPSNERRLNTDELVASEPSPAPARTPPRATTVQPRTPPPAPVPARGPLMLPGAIESASQN